jgi:hypothetical protein
MLTIIILWAAFVGGVGYWQNHTKHGVDMRADPALVWTGIEKRAKIVTDTYAPPPRSLVNVPLPQARPIAATEKPVKPMSLAEKIRRCTPDAIRLCKDAIPNHAKIIACMIAHRDQLSARCAPAFEKPMKINAAVPLKASKAAPCALKGTSHRTATKHKSHRAPTSQLVNVDEYHDGTSIYWSYAQHGPGPTDSGGDHAPSPSGGSHSSTHAGGHHAPPHHTLC